MEVVIQNIGKVKKASIDLSKNLIVFTGKNNSGKTWVSYVLYALFKDSTFLSKSTVSKYFDSSLILGLDEQNDTKRVVYDKKELLKYFNSILTIAFKEKLPDYFANTKFDFSKFSIELTDLNRFHEKLLFFEVEKDNHVSLDFFVDDNNLILDFKFIKDLSFESFIGKKQIYIEFSNSSRINDLYILQNLINVKTVNFIPAERVGISIFSTDISANRISNNSSLDYQLPVRDALKDWIRVPNLVNRRKENEFSKIAKLIEFDVLGGDLMIGEGGSIEYKINERSSLSYFNTSSNIKSLSSLIFYLKYYARNGGVLFIDEPELNLHPDNQRKIARYIAQISNLGIKVFVSTHSDYIIREFNNLIMMSKKHKDTNKIIKEFNYQKNEILYKENVCAYFFDKNDVVELELDETGFEVTSIDETIEIQNKITNNLFFKLFDS